jgi:hypothetical protein
VARERSTIFHVPRPHPLIAALQPLIDAAGAQTVRPDDVAGSDVPLMWDGEVVGAARLPPLSRLEKQQAIRRLDELGAFVLRRAVEDVSEAVGISRITVYSYLNALHR